MKTRTLLCTLTLAALLGAAIPAVSQESAASENPLNQLAWMVGGKWQADGDRGPDGKPFHAEWSCKWGANHRTLEFTVWFLVDGRLTPVYEGLYAWHPAKKKLIFLYTDNQGDLTEGEAVMDGDRLEQDFHNVGVDGTARPFRSTIVRRGPDAYDWDVQSEKDGVWTKIFGLQYKRSRT
jgi:hypothetical protein